MKNLGQRVGPFPAAADCGKCSMVPWYVFKVRPVMLLRRSDPKQTEIAGKACWVWGREYKPPGLQVFQTSTKAIGNVASLFSK